MTKQLEFHALADAYPLMPETELQQLITRMRESGFNRTFPIVRFQGKILDGRNRYKAALEASVDPFFVDFKGTEEEAAQFVIDANEHRRHLTVEWLQKRRAERVSRVIEARSQGASERVIAEQEGVSKSQIRRDIKAAEISQKQDTDSSQVVPPDQLSSSSESASTSGKLEKVESAPRVTGADGKNHPAKKPETPAPSRQAKQPEKVSRERHDDIGKLVRYADDLASGKPKFAPMRDECHRHLQAAKNSIVALEKATR